MAHTYQRKSGDKRWVLKYQINHKPRYKYSPHREVVEGHLHTALRVEMKCRSGNATTKEINRWIEENFLTLEEACHLFDGYADTIQRSGPTKMVDFDAIEAAFDPFILSKENNPEDPTSDTHIENLRQAKRVIAWLKEDFPTLRLTTRHVEDWHQDLKIRYAPTQVNIHTTRLRQLMNIAVKLEMIPVNPCDDADVLTVPWKDLEQRRNLSKREITAVLGRLKEKEIYHSPTPIAGQRARPMHGCLPIAVILGLYTGVRNIEARWCSWSWFNFDDDTMHLGRTKCRATGQMWIPKGKAQRIIGLNATLKDALIAERSRQDELKIRGQFVIPSGTFKRPDLRGKPISAKALEVSFAEFVSNEFDLFDDPPPTFYSLRHTFCTELLRATGDLSTVQLRMGHNNIKTTEKYLHGLKTAEAKVENELSY